MIIKPASLANDFIKLQGVGFDKKGLSTGFSTLDPHLKLAKGYLAVLGAVPGMGKSEYVDGLLVNMSLLHGWRTLFFSPENHPTENHMMKIAEKYIGKKMNSFTKKDIDQSLEYLDKYFTWMYPEKPTLESLLTIAKQQAADGLIDCLILDPWNNIAHSRSTGMLHEYLGEALREVIKFCRDFNIFTMIVTHPTKLGVDRDGRTLPVDMYSLSDGAMWRNKADYGIIINRPDMSKNQMEVSIQKIKNKWMGKLGAVMLDYDFQTGRFKCTHEDSFLLPTEIEAAF